MNLYFSTCKASRDVSLPVATSNGIEGLNRMEGLDDAPFFGTWPSIKPMVAMHNTNSVFFIFSFPEICS